jgi:DNA-binding HxlR family transcriptional regulator
MSFTFPVGISAFIAPLSDSCCDSTGGAKESSSMLGAVEARRIAERGRGGEEGTQKCPRTRDSPVRDSAYDVLNPRCPTQQVLDRIASKWTMLVILALSERPRRYAELQRRVTGVTKKMLTQTLRALERDGLVERRVYDTVPVQTEYELSALGRSLADAVATIRAWAYDNVEDVAGARRRFDDRAPTPA